ncbi:Serine/threonine-protein kinase PknD [compost metagenome]
MLPQQTQALVGNTQSLKILLRHPGLLGSDRTAIANGPGAQTLTMSALPPGGGYTLYAGAYTGPNATGLMTSWGVMPLVIKSGANGVSLGLSVRIASGSEAADLTQGPAGNEAQLGGAQWSQTTLSAFELGQLDDAEAFTPTRFAYLRSYGGSGTLNGQFGSGVIEDMAFDPDGNCYVADRYNHRVQKFDRNFQFVRAWGNGTTWTTGTPAPAPVAASGNGSFNQPLGIAVDAQRNVYVSDVYNYRIQKFDRDGKFLRAWGSGTVWNPDQAPPAPTSGSGNLSFADPHKIAIDRDGNLWVADNTNARVLKFTPNGQFLMGLGYGATWTGAAPAVATSSANGAFWRAGGLAIDKQGYLYVADLDNYRIQKFASNGTFIAKWGSAGLADGQFPNDVFPLCLDPFSRLLAGNNAKTVVTPTIENFLQVFTTSGQYVARLAGPTASQLKNVRTMAFDASGDLYVGDSTSGLVSKFRGASPQDPLGGIRLAGYRSPGPSNFKATGRYVSPVLDAGGVVTWRTLYWDVSALPAGTGVSAEISTSNDGTTWSAWQIVAPSSVAGANMASLAAYASRQLRYRLSLSSGNPAETPEVQEAGVMY